ncbi:hypothetical protein [Xanthomonas sp. 10-10]|uniref:Uncharacterized protein n=1 Tax=Xanthomonas sp. 10-10 TaxID=3115848 RepID=A0AAU7PC27_9XANT
MGIRQLQPRSQNNSARLGLFIRLWDLPLDEMQMVRIAEEAPMSQRRSEFGNLNNDGNPFPSQSCLASRFHPNFLDVVEPGVKDLLVAIAFEHNLVTYTSCEGHDYRPVGHMPDERHVGIVPRSSQEMDLVVNLFNSLGCMLNAQLSCEPVEIAMMVHSVREDHVVYPAVDLYLSKRSSADWDDYFYRVDAATECLIKALKEAPSIG